MDVELILNKLSALGYVRLHKIRGNYYQVYCPFHAGGQEQKPSCGVLLHEEYRNGQKYPEGLWHCFACGYADSMENTVNKLLTLHAVKQSAIEWLTENIPGFVPSNDFEHLIPDNIWNGLQNKFAIDYIKLNTNAVKPEYVSEEELAKYRFTVPYMYERKLTDEIIAKYDIGVDINWIPPGRKTPVPCITFPVRDINGNTLFLCRRSIQGKLFNYPTNVTKPVYGIDMISSADKSVIICESCFNALTAVRYGYKAVALLGTGNPYQISQLRQLGIHEFVICMDGDEAGRRAAQKLKRALQDIALIWTVPMPDGKDINDCSEEEFNALYAQKE